MTEGCFTAYDFSAASFPEGIGGHGGAWKHGWLPRDEGLGMVLFCFQQNCLGLVTHRRTILWLDVRPHFLNTFYIQHELK